MSVKERLVRRLVDLIGSTEYGNRSLIGNNFRKGFLQTIADHLVDNNVTVQEWFPSSDPPKDRGEYLCYFKYEPAGPDVICQNTYYGSGRWLSETNKVTHWTYLPPAPRKEVH